LESAAIFTLQTASQYFVSDSKVFDLVGNQTMSDMMSTIPTQASDPPRFSNIDLLFSVALPQEFGDTDPLPSTVPFTEIVGSFNCTNDTQDLGQGQQEYQQPFYPQATYFQAPQQFTFHPQAPLQQDTTTTPYPYEPLEGHYEGHYNDSSNYSNYPDFPNHPDYPNYPAGYYHDFPHPETPTSDSSPSGFLTAPKLDTLMVDSLNSSIEGEKSPTKKRGRPKKVATDEKSSGVPAKKKAKTARQPKKLGRAHLLNQDVDDAMYGLQNPDSMALVFDPELQSKKSGTAAVTAICTVEAPPIQDIIQELNSAPKRKVGRPRKDTNHKKQTGKQLVEILSCIFCH